MAQIQLAVQAKKLPPQYAPVMMEVHKIRAFDELFKETGVEEEDITKAFLEYKLSESQEFKDMMAKRQAIQDVEDLVYNSESFGNPTNYTKLQ